MREAAKGRRRKATNSRKSIPNYGDWKKRNAGTGERSNKNICLNFWLELSHYLFWAFCLIVRLAGVLILTEWAKIAGRTFTTEFIATLARQHRFPIVQALN
jgi:hypothetical protein